MNSFVSSTSDCNDPLVWLRKCSSNSRVTFGFRSSEPAMQRAGQAKAECRIARISFTLEGVTSSSSDKVFTTATETMSPDRLNAFSSKPVYRCCVMILRTDSFNCENGGCESCADAEVGQRRIASNGKWNVFVTC